MSDLSALDWSDPRCAHRGAQAVLATIEDPRPLLEPARNRNPQLAEVDRSAEKTTHFKWFLAADPHGRFALWLNEYKPATHRRVGHAETAHNHRFWFTSLLIGGGFVHAVFDPCADGTLKPQRTVPLRAGDTYVVEPTAVHTLREIADGTVTLIVQSAPVRSHSDVYENGTVTRYHDLPSARRSFNQRLLALTPFSSDGRRHH